MEIYVAEDVEEYLEEMAERKRRYEEKCDEPIPSAIMDVCKRVKELDRLYVNWVDGVRLRD